MNEKITEEKEIYLEKNGKVVFDEKFPIYERIQEELKKITKNPEKYFKTTDRKAIDLTIEIIKHLFSHAENDNFEITDAYLTAKTRSWIESFLENQLLKELTDVQAEIKALTEEERYRIAREMFYAEYDFFDLAETFSISPLTIKQLMKNWQVSLSKDTLTFEGDPTFRKKKLTEEDILFLEDWVYQYFKDTNNKPFPIENLSANTLFAEKTIIDYLSEIGCQVENNLLIAIGPIRDKREIRPEEYFALRILTMTSSANIFIHHDDYSRVINARDLTNEDFSFLNEKLKEIEQHFHNRKKTNKDIWRDR